MAAPHNSPFHDRLPTNVPGDLYVDDSCIDCGSCRWIAPDVFDYADGHSRVYRQPESAEGLKAGLEALVSCPTGSIAATEHHDIAAVTVSFPRPIGDGVYHCGFHDRSSFGATSYLIVREGGNVLVDSPRFNRGLAKRIDALGGVDLMFLTHRDDVADHAKYAKWFACDRILHADDVTAGTRDVERQPDGVDPIRLASDLVMIPVPGHTRGSACLLYDNRVLFSGDHVAWSIPGQRITAFRNACWYDWDEQIVSMKRLTEWPIARILPGHGAPCSFPASDMRQRLLACISWMQHRR